jgi:uncharacterized protein YegP (UPF0339 family)
VFKDDQGAWCWHLIAADNERIALSGTRYKTQQECLAAVARVKQSRDSRILVTASASSHVRTGKLG